MRRALLLLALALLAGPLHAADRPLVVVTADRVPMAYVENGRLTGLLVELAEEAFRRAGRRVEIRLLPWPRCLAEMKSGEADAVLTLFKTPERERQFAFAEEEVLRQTESLFMKKGGAIRFDGNLDAFAGKRVGVVYQTSYGPRLDQALADDRLEGWMLLDVNLAEIVLLPKQDSLQTHQLEQRQKHADERPLGPRISEQAAQ